MKFLHRATIKGGKIKFVDKDRFQEEVYKHEGQEIHITIGKLEKKRSIYENNYYWGVVIKMFSEETGIDQNDMHEF